MFKVVHEENGKDKPALPLLNIALEEQLERWEGEQEACISEDSVVGICV